MLRALLCPSSGTRNYNVDYHICRFVSQAKPRPTANQERTDQCGNQHYSRKLLMMGIVMPETC
jgi:spore coat protein CotF